MNVRTLIEQLEADARWYEERAKNVYYIDRAIFKAKAEAMRVAIRRVTEAYAS